MLRVYRYRAYPTSAQAKALDHQSWLLRQFYNAALQQRIEAWDRQGRSLNYYDQSAEIAALKAECPEYADLHTHLLQDALKRLHLAFRAFFRRLKSGEKPGFPRFKGRGRYNTFSFQDAAHGNGAAIVAGGNRVRVAGVGNVKFKYHSSDPLKRGYRPMVGTLKTIGMTADGDGHWYVLITRDVPQPTPLPPTGREIGLDPGLHNFLADSDGGFVENPRPLAAARLQVERAQRKVARRTKGSKRRGKARVDLAKRYAHARNVRNDFLHKTAHKLVKEYDRIALEDTKLLGLSRGRLAKSFHDAAHGRFSTILTAKVEETGRILARPEARGTTVDCSECGLPVPKDLSVRVHQCPGCGYTADRDTNAARNILHRGQAIWNAICVPLPSAPSIRQRPVWGRRRAAPAREDGNDPRSPNHV